MPPRWGRKAVRVADLEDFATAVGALIKGRTPLPAATISLDTDGTPYWDPEGGTRFVLKDADGTPYHAASPWPSISTDTDGTPVISL